MEISVSVKTLTALLLFFTSLNLSAEQISTAPPDIAEKYRWLYEMIIPQDLRAQFPDESLKSFYVHLFDNYEVFPHPAKIASRNLGALGRIEGRLGYVNNAIKKRYSYDVLQSTDGTRIISVKIHFQEPTGNDLANFARKIQAAEEIWNNLRPTADFNYVFKFTEVATEAEANFSVLIADTTRGPYDIIWGRDWSPVTVAHELGHMMGIGDEYQTLSGKADCLKQSLMCLSYSGKLMPHHYYFILRRLLRPDGTN